MKTERQNVQLQRSILTHAWFQEDPVHNSICLLPQITTITGKLQAVAAVALEYYEVNTNRNNI